MIRFNDQRSTSWKQPELNAQIKHLVMSCHHRHRHHHHSSLFYVFALFVLSLQISPPIFSLFFFVSVYEAVNWFGRFFRVVGVFRLTKNAIYRLLEFSHKFETICVGLQPLTKISRQWHFFGHFTKLANSINLRILHTQ